MDATDLRTELKVFKATRILCTLQTLDVIRSQRSGEPADQEFREAFKSIYIDLIRYTESLGLTIPLPHDFIGDVSGVVGDSVRTLWSRYPDLHSIIRLAEASEKIKALSVVPRELLKSQPELIKGLYSSFHEHAVASGLSAKEADEWIRLAQDGQSYGDLGEKIMELLRTRKQHKDPSEMANIEININNSAVGVLNTGTIQSVATIGVNIKHLYADGKNDVAEALSKLTEATANNRELLDEFRMEIIDRLEEISRQARMPAESRLKPTILKSIFRGLSEALSSAGALASVWATWGDKLRSYFGL